MRILAVCLISLAFGFFGSMPLAGPIAVMVFSRASRRRYGEALYIALGAAAAEAIYAGVAFFSFTSLLADHPIVVPISRGVTAVVLSALGVRFALWSQHEKKDKYEQRKGTWLVGFSLSAINPTLLVTWSAAVAFLYSKGLGVSSGLVAVPFGACAGAGIAGWFAILVMILRRFEGKLPIAVLTWTIRVLGVALVGLGVWSAVQLVQWLEGDRGTPGQGRVSLCSHPCSSPGQPSSIPRSPSRPPSTSCSGTGWRAPRDASSRTCSI
ncbi:MAG TPA: LysE family transporter [Polyangiaceae bacterium]|jgi:threonine/homoserine/homoserine lactone efflux protein